MKLRNVERSTEFSKRVESECNIHNVQGIHKSDGKYSLTFEAIDMENDEFTEYKQVLPEREIYIKSCLAEKLGCSFAIFLHKKEKDDIIWVGIFTPDHEIKKPKLLDSYQFNEETFIQWWNPQKHSKQTKSYRSNMSKALSESYFDRLFDKYGSSWGMNLDGFLVDETDGDVEILALIENRFSTKESLYSYDPAKYYQPSAYNSGDYRTWDTLIELKQILNVPLFLCTFSRLPEMQEKIGVAEVKMADHVLGLIYDKCSPNQNVKSSVKEFKDWIDLNIGKSVQVCC